MLKIKVRNARKIVDLLNSLFSPKKLIQAYRAIGLYVDRRTKETFQKQGARDGHKKWKAFSKLTLHPAWKAAKSAFPKSKGYNYNQGKWSKRPGSDKAKRRKYSANSKLLQASGQTRHSFKIKKVNKTSVVYGSTYKNAANQHYGAGNLPARKILFLSSKDIKNISNKYRAFVLT